MDSSFFGYLRQLELMAFFSGYPLLYSIIILLAGSGPGSNSSQRRLPKLLPFAYALVGTLYLGLQLKNLWPDYSLGHLRQAAGQSILRIWGLLAVLFWIPALNRKRLWSLAHSAVFFFLLLKDLFLHQVGSPPDNDIVRNDMKLYTVSLMINLAAFVLIWLLYLGLNRYRRH